MSVFWQHVVIAALNGLAIVVAAYVGRNGRRKGKQ